MSRDAIKTVQAYLNSTAGTKLSVDGVMGSQTLGAIAAHKDSDSLLNTLTTKLKIDTKIEGVYTREELTELARTASAATGAPFEYLMFAFYLENYPAGDGVRTEYKATYRGLGQFGRRAWSAVGLSNWEDGVKDPVLSAWATGRYYMLNKAVFEKQFPGRVFTKEIAYTFHNLGPGGGAANLQGNPPSYLAVQSDKAKATAALARRQINDQSSAGFIYT